MEIERAQKLDAIADAIRAGMKELPGSNTPSDLALHLYVASIIDHLDKFGYKVMKVADA